MLADCSRVFIRRVATFRTWGQLLGNVHGPLVSHYLLLVLGQSYIHQAKSRLINFWASLDNDDEEPR
jgi:hypothetical protein